MIWAIECSKAMLIIVQVILLFKGHQKRAVINYLQVLYMNMLSVYIASMTNSLIAALNVDNYLLVMHGLLDVLRTNADVHFRFKLRRILTHAIDFYDNYN